MAALATLNNIKGAHTLTLNPFNAFTPLPASPYMAQFFSFKPFE